MYDYLKNLAVTGIASSSARFNLQTEKQGHHSNNRSLSKLRYRHGQGKQKERRFGRPLFKGKSWV